MLFQGTKEVRILVKEKCSHVELVARSQAREILCCLETFAKIELDFTDIEFMGPSFADEIFRVYQNKHPEVELIVLNAGPMVRRMIQHVKR